MALLWVLQVSAYMPPSQTDDWATPMWLFNQLDAIHHFDLDAAASATNRKCNKWFGLDHEDPERRDALAHQWTGQSVWVNPPYGRVIKDWIIKADQESSLRKIVMLLPARTDTAWFHDYATKHQVTFLRGRLKFGNSATAAPFPSMIVEMKP